MTYGMNDNQNVFMEGKRTTSRVTNEPGGKSSVQLGWDPSQDGKKTGKKSVPGDRGRSSVHLGWDPSQDASKTAIAPKETNQEKERHENFMKVVGSTAASKARTNSIDDDGVARRTILTNEGAEQRSTSRGRAGVSSNAYANGASQNVGNVITNRPTSRVTQPPGGRSSITFA